MNSSKLDKFVERVNQNLADYHDQLSGFGNRELIDMAGKISTMADAHYYMTESHDFSDEELDFYLQFQNPLEVISDYWAMRRNDISDMSFALGDISQDRQTLLTIYPLIEEATLNTGSSLRRYTDKLAEVRKFTESEPAVSQQKQSLADRLQAANEKVKAQKSQSDKTETQSGWRGEKYAR